MKSKYPCWIDYVALLTVAVVVISMLSSGGCTSPKSAWVEADRALYNALSPMIPLWVEADTMLTDLQREDYHQLMQAWKMALEDGEKLVGDD